MKSFLLVIILLVVAFFGYGFYVSSTPEGKEKTRARDAIDLCWKDHDRKSFDESTKIFIAQTCEKMEADYRKKFGSKP